MTQLTDKERERLESLESVALDRYMMKSNYSIVDWLNEDEKKEWLELCDKFWKEE
jgi:hypothetical protein